MITPKETKTTKTKSIMLAILIVSMLVFSSAASAAWYVVTVNESGIDPTTGVTFVSLTYVSGPEPTWAGPRWYTASGDNANALLAVGLSAISMGNTCTASLDDVTEWSVVSGFFMRNQ
jgi:hypothetical protein